MSGSKEQQPYIPQEGDVVRLQLFDLFDNVNDVRKFLTVYYDEQLDEDIICFKGDSHGTVDIKVGRDLTRD